MKMLNLKHGDNVVIYVNVAENIIVVKLTHGRSDTLSLKTV
jgi:antitoxin component of MazEF toxin-antitoxin module